MTKVEMVNEELKKQNLYFRQTIADLINKRTIDAADRVVLLEKCKIVHENYKAADPTQERAESLRNQVCNLNARLSQSKQRIEKLLEEIDELKKSVMTKKDFDAIAKKMTEQSNQIKEYQKKIHNLTKQYVYYKGKAELADRGSLSKVTDRLLKELDASDISLLKPLPAMVVH